MIKAEITGQSPVDAPANAGQRPQTPKYGWKTWRALYRRALRLRLRFFLRDLTGLRLENVQGIRLIVLPGVFNGVLLRTGAFLATTLDSSVISPRARVLDLGTGSGIGAIFAARWTCGIVATDINPDAVRCAQINALAQHLEHRIQTRLGDLFEPVRGERFDLILFNPPYYYGAPRNLADHAWRSVDVFERFLRELPAHLTETGCARVVLSTDGDVEQLLDAVPELQVRIVRQRDFINERLTVYEIRVRADRSSQS